jgi:hypothetical protein
MKPLNPILESILKKRLLNEQVPVGAVRAAQSASRAGSGAVRTGSMTIGPSGIAPAIEGISPEVISGARSAIQTLSQDLMKGNSSEAILKSTQIEDVYKLVDAQTSKILADRGYTVPKNAEEAEKMSLMVLSQILKDAELPYSRKTEPLVGAIRDRVYLQTGFKPGEITPEEPEEIPAPKPIIPTTPPETVPVPVEVPSPKTPEPTEQKPTQTPDEQTVIKPSGLFGVSPGILQALMPVAMAAAANKMNRGKTERRKRDAEEDESGGGGGSGGEEEQKRQKLDTLELDGDPIETFLKKEKLGQYSGFYSLE